MRRHRPAVHIGELCTVARVAIAWACQPDRRHRSAARAAACCAAARAAACCAAACAAACCASHVRRRPHGLQNRPERARHEQQHIILTHDRLRAEPRRHCRQSAPIGDRYLEDLIGAHLMSGAIILMSQAISPRRPVTWRFDRCAPNEGGNHTDEPGNQPSATGNLET